MKRILLVLFFITSQLLADDEPNAADRSIHTEVSDGAVPSLVNLTALPTSIVNGSVNVISGDFCEVEQDDIVSGGPDPYILGHSYFSSSLEEGNLGDGWNFAHSHRLEVFAKVRIDYVKAKDVTGVNEGYYNLMSLEEYERLHGPSKSALVPPHRS